MFRSFVAAGAAERARLRDDLGLPQGARVGVSIGALSTRKDPLVIVQAMQSVAERDFVLLFVGAGELEAACRREASDDARIRFTGQVTDVANNLRAADFLVSASRSEGLPNAVLEAMACGLRVVLSDIGPHHELLQLAPAAGAAFPVGDANALAEALRHEARRDTPVNPESTAGLSKLIGARRMSQQYQAIYRDLAARSAA